MIRFCLFVAIACASIGCTSSLVYAPSLHQVANTQPGDVVVSGGVAALPETRPDRAGGDAAFGIDGKLGYQFSEQIRIEGRYFAATGTYSDGPIAQGFGGILYWDIEKKDDLTLTAAYTVQTMMQDNSLEALGMGASGGIRWQASDDAHVYGLIGLVAGSTGAIPVVTLLFNAPSNEWGAGAMLNTGAGLTFFDNFTVNGEVATLFGYDAFAEQWRFILSPSVQLTWKFSTR